MTEPTPLYDALTAGDPAPSTSPSTAVGAAPAPPATLDQSVIDAGRAYAAALQAEPYDQAAADTARQQLDAARAARWHSAP